METPRKSAQIQLGTATGYRLYEIQVNGISSGIHKCYFDSSKNPNLINPDDIIIFEPITKPNTTTVNKNYFEIKTGIKQHFKIKVETIFIISVFHLVGQWITEIFKFLKS